MIIADIAAIEELTQKVVKAASEAEESSDKLRVLSAEIQNDPQLSLFPRYEIICEELAGAVQTLSRGSDMLQTLKNAVLPIPEQYVELEKRSRNIVESLIVRADSAAVAYRAATVCKDPIEQTGTVVLQNRVQKLLSGSTTEVKKTNIAHVTKAVKKEYGAVTVTVTEKV